ncbi:tripartite tricarboxylate transporter TctB family protein [Cellulosimicrobium sp. NPDC057127]|uniref:tripartite tricarboxylate transporter TctB family protein n=1 Tax=Cellulosimicrobium sp. NPDC057127 TaxID=3346026 RepID=UPI00362A7107
MKIARSTRSTRGAAAPSSVDGAAAPAAGTAHPADVQPAGASPTDAMLVDAATRDDDTVPAAEPSRRLEIGSALVALVVLGGLAFLARRIEVRVETGGIDPRWWPELLGTVGAVLAAALLVVAVVRPPDRGDLEATTRTGLVRLVATVALAAGYLVLWPLVGFLVATPVFLLAAVALFGARGWRTLVLFPLLTTAGIYLLFHTLLEVPL